MQCIECSTIEETLGLGAIAKADCLNVVCPEDNCEHGGLCVPVHHRPKCFCPAGFSGARCEINVDECASAPCYNGGTCVDLPQGYRCDREDGFGGKQCQVEDSDCDISPCPDRAMCRNEPGIGNYSCLCKSGYT